MEGKVAVDRPTLKHYDAPPGSPRDCREPKPNGVHKTSPFPVGNKGHVHFDVLMRRQVARVFHRGLPKPVFFFQLMGLELVFFLADELHIDLVGRQAG